MKRISIYICIATAMFMVGCNSYLDINTNPNQATTVTPNLILPQALAGTAAVLNRYNTYGAQLGGYSANAGGYGGFNELVSYAYTNSNYNDLWPYSYDNLEDYQYIMNQTKNDPANVYFYGVATIMRAYGFQLLVDTFNDIPYTHALKGADDLTPAYDKGDFVYKQLAIELDSGIARIARGNTMVTKNPIANYDILFKGDMTKWVQLANTIKLKLMVHGFGIVTFDNPTFDAAGFLTSDALINPGYTRDINRENPAWNGWAYAYTGSAGNKAWVPTLWMLSWFDGTNLNDLYRGTASYYEFGKITKLTGVGGSLYTNGIYTNVDLTVVSGGISISAAKANITVAGGAVTSISITDSKGYAVGDILSAKSADIGGTGSGFQITVTEVMASGDIANQLGNETVNAPKCPTGSRWYSGFDRTGTSAGATIGILKGPTASIPLMMASESNFLQAEGALNGFPVGTSDAAAFDAGIKSSFAYLYSLPGGTSEGNAAADATAYLAANSGNFLADYSVALTHDQKLEAIITQKYIALNYTNSHEGWNDYRRTGYPTQSAWPNPTKTFASTVSQSTRPDKLPSRILYPTSEAQYNPENNPSGISPFTSLIFWAK